MPPKKEGSVDDLAISKLQLGDPIRRSSRESPKFNGTEEAFGMWKRQFEAYTMTGPCEAILFSKDVKYRANDYQNLLYANIIQSFTNHATFTIIQGVEMGDPQCGFKVWEKLCNHFQGNDGKRIYTLFQDLNSKQGSQTAIEFLERKITVQSLLIQIGQPVSDQMVINVTLNGLKGEYHAIRNMLLLQIGPDYTLQQLTQTIRTLSFHLESSAVSNASAFMGGEQPQGRGNGGRGRGNGRGNGRFGGRGPGTTGERLEYDPLGRRYGVCWNCFEKGHRQEYCPNPRVADPHAKHKALMADVPLYSVIIVARTAISHGSARLSPNLMVAIPLRPLFFLTPLLWPRWVIYLSILLTASSQISLISGCWILGLRPI